MWGRYQGPNGLTLILAWISNNIHCKLWGEINNPFPTFNGATVEVWWWISSWNQVVSSHTLYSVCDYLSMVGFKLIHVCKGPFWNILTCLQGRSVVRDLSYPSDILQVSDECRWSDAHLMPRHLLILCRATVLLKWKSTQLNILILWWLYLTKVHDYSKFLRSYQIKVKIKQWKSMFYQIWTWENFHLSNTQTWVRNSTPPQFIYEGCSLRHIHMNHQA